MSIAKEQRAKLRAQVAAEAAIARGVAVCAIAAAVEHLGEVGSNHLGHLTYRQATRFHKATEVLSDLVDELEGTS